MDDQETIESPAWRDAAPQSQKTRPYDLLMRQSKKMGRTATKTFDVTKEFLKQDVSVLKPEHIRRRIKVRSEADAQRRTDEAAPGDQKVSKQQDLRQIVQTSRELLCYAQTVILPNNLFPDTVAVDRTKVSITKKSFFWSSEVISIRIEDVLNVSTSVGPLFGSLTLSSRVMNSTDHYEIGYFWRKDAIYLKHIIQGYVIAQHNKIDVAHLEKQELIDTLLELGHDSDL